MGEVGALKTIACIPGCLMGCSRVIWTVSRMPCLYFCMCMPKNSYAPDVGLQLYGITRGVSKKGGEKKSNTLPTLHQSISG